MKRYIYITLILIVVALSLLIMLYLTNHKEVQASPDEDDVHSTSLPFVHTDGSTQTRHVDWELAEEVLMRYVNFVDNYISDSSGINSIDTCLCKGIVDFYTLNNPADGALAEIQSITAYHLFLKNDSLCKMLEVYMHSHQIPQSLCDTIWIRIAKDLHGYMLIEEEFDTCIIDERRVFKFFFDKGYWFDDYEDYCPYTSSVLCD